MRSWVSWVARVTRVALNPTDIFPRVCRGDGQDAQLIAQNLIIGDEESRP